MKSEKFKDQDRRNELLKEYELTQQMAIHYDTLNWQIGSILIAGIFITFGIMGNNLSSYPILSAISLFVLIVWNRFYFRHKAIQNTKFRRLHEIEIFLEFKQHLNVEKSDAQNLQQGLHGGNLIHILTFCIPAIILAPYLIPKLSDFKVTQKIWAMLP